MIIYWFGEVGLVGGKGHELYCSILGNGAAFDVTFWRIAVRIENNRIPYYNFSCPIISS
jgi:hypothetical protein